MHKARILGELKDLILVGWLEVHRKCAVACKAGTGLPVVVGFSRPCPAKCGPGAILRHRVEPAECMYTICMYVCIHSYKALDKYVCIYIHHCTWIYS